MKHRTCLLPAIAVVVVALCSSCYTYSLYSWFGENVKVFEPRLLGEWGDEEELIVVERGPHDTYDIVGLPVEDTWPSTHGRLAKIDGVYYLDLMWQSNALVDGASEWLYGVHLLVKVELEEDRVRYTVLDIEKLERLRPATLRFVEIGDNSNSDVEEGILVAASTRELQKFIKKHGAKSDIWMSCDEEGDCWLPRR